MNTTLLVLAAGVGSRYGGLKQIDQLGPSGERIIDYSVFDAKKAGFTKIVFVIRKDIEKEFNDVFLTNLSKYINVDYVFQELDGLPDGLFCPEGRVKPWGTAHAVLVAEEKIKGPFAVINADDFYGYDAFKAMQSFFTAGVNTEVNNYSMVGYRLKNTLSEHGYVSRGECRTNTNGYLMNIIERTQISKTANEIYYVDDMKKNHLLLPDTIVSMNFWGFQYSVFYHFKKLFSEFIQKNITNLKSEFYIPSAIDIMINSNISKVKVLECNAKWFGVTYKEDKPLVINKLKEYFENGIYPSPLWK